LGIGVILALAAIWVELAVQGISQLASYVFG
jgi:hypothetical protein